MRYNERLRELRESKKISQKQVAEIIGIGQRTYSDYEKGDIRISTDTLLILAKFFNVSMDYLSCASDIRAEYPNH